MKSFIINLSKVLLIMFLVIALFSFLVWDITWITRNTFFPILGKVIIFFIGIFLAPAIETNN